MGKKVHTEDRRGGALFRWHAIVANPLKKVSKNPKKKKLREGKKVKKAGN